MELIIKFIIKEELNPGQIWNADESGMSLDAKSCSAVTIKNERALKVTKGTGRDNITILGCCSAAGQALDPLIVFKAERWTQNYRVPDDLRKDFTHLTYAKSSNGWMDSSIFELWLTNFASQVLIRPLLLILDGHLSHVSLKLYNLPGEKTLVFSSSPLM